MTAASVLETGIVPTLSALRFALERGYEEASHQLIHQLSELVGNSDTLLVAVANAPEWAHSIAQQYDNIRIA